jgi:hypothetical protein
MILLFAVALLGCSTDAPVTANHSPVDNPTLAGAMAPNLSEDGEGALLTWLEPSALPDGHRLRIARFSSTSFQSAETIVSDVDFFVNWADVPSVARANNGSLIAHWAEKSGTDTYAYDVALGYSQNGIDWTTIGAAHTDKTKTEHGFVSLAPDSLGGVRAVWLDGREMAKNGPMTLRTARIDKGLHDEQVLDLRTCECCGTDMVMTTQGPLVAFRDRELDEERNIGIIRKTETGWTKSTAVHQDGWTIDGCPVNGPALANLGDTVALSWFTSPNNRPEVRIAFSHDAGASWGPPLSIDKGEGDQRPLGRVAVEMVNQTTALVIWLDAAASQGLIRARLVHTDGSLGPAVGLVKTSQSRASGFPVTARVKDGVLMAYTIPGDIPRIETVLINANLYSDAN